MNSKKPTIFKIFDEAAAHLSKNSNNLDIRAIDNVLSSIYSPGESFQYIFDFSTRKFVYVSDSVFEVLGDKPSDFGTDEFLSRIHPDDMAHFLKCEEIAGHFLFSFLQKEEIQKYKVSYQMRMKDKHGNYRLILHQAIAFEVDSDARLSATLANQSDISHITTTNNYKVSFINISGGPSYYNIDSIDSLQQNKGFPINLSKREVEVLRYLSEGLTSQEVADYLFISPATVRTHRNNILRKTKFKSLLQAAAYCIRNGLI